MNNDPRDAAVSKLVMAMSGIAQGIYSESGAAEVAADALAAYRAGQPAANLIETQAHIDPQETIEYARTQLYKGDTAGAVSWLINALAALAQEKKS